MMLQSLSGDLARMFDDIEGMLTSTGLPSNMALLIVGFSITTFIFAFGLIVYRWIKA